MKNPVFYVFCAFLEMFHRCLIAFGWFLMVPQERVQAMGERQSDDDDDEACRDCPASRSASSFQVLFPLDLHPTTMNSCSGFGERRCCPPRPLTCSPGANHNFTQHPLQKRRHSYMLSAPTCTCTPTFYIKAALPNLTGPAECAQRLNKLSNT